MSISTPDTLVKGQAAGRYVPFFKINPSFAAGRIASYWGTAGVPGAGGYDTTLNGATLSAPQNGQIPWTDPSGSDLAYLATLRIRANFGTYAPFLLADRLWQNQFDKTSTSVQSITSPTWPARDANGSTNGEAVLLCVETAASMGAAAPTFTVTYTNSTGTGSRTGTNIDTQGVTSASSGSVFRIGLQAGDTGVRSVQSIQLSTSWLSGTACLVAYRILAIVTQRAAYAGRDLGPLQTGLPRAYNGSVPYLMVVGAGGSGQAIHAGSVQFAMA